MNVKKTLGALFFTAGVGLAAYNVEQALVEKQPNNKTRNLVAAGLALTGGMLGFKLRRKPESGPEQTL